MQESPGSYHPDGNYGFGGYRVGSATPTPPDR